MSSLDVRAINEAELRKEPCPATRQEYRVFLAEQAFDRAVARGESDTTREIGGVLVGELLRDDHGPYLRIEETIDALHAEEKGAELTFTHATWEHIHKEMDSRHPGKRVVGWYHTHPGFGVFLSDRDQFIHKSFFNLPFQVAFVYDPKAKEHGLFAWRDGDIARVRRYWIGQREQQWDGARVAGKPADPGGGDKARAAAGAAATERSARAAAAPAAELRDDAGPSAAVSWIGIAVVAALLVGFAGYWLGSSAARGALADAQLDVAKARADAVQGAIGTLQTDLVGILRETIGDQAVRKPAAAAIAELDRAIAVLHPPAPAPAPGGASAAPAPGGASAAPAPGSAAPAPGSAAPAPGAAGTAAAAPAAAPNVEQALALLETARAGLARLLDDRRSAETALAELERVARRGGASRADLSRDVAEQRSGLGTLYAELAADAVKGGDAARGKRLLAAAAHLDPGNRQRYEKQLQTFDKSGTLPQVPQNAAAGSAGSAGSGDQR